ncbi:hypothetical protein [Flavobacterium foetidum]|uniref:hypothetical protein n=1 Tax=Flavobacterium foetidum TaxID=2026681 RepID=UPI0010751D24|nr:hypothetical protein [Flavobacterium foetidum]KAF2514694.1 hypothetical protein E0W73_12140 [Flavobacterium foetidum]
MKALKKIQKLIFSLTILFLSLNNSNAQSTLTLKQLSKKFGGTWYNSTKKHYLTFTFEKGYDYVTVATWKGKINSLQNIDVYKAYIEANKLILPAENDDHHGCYCEIDIEKNLLVYKCNQGLNFTDNFLNTKKPIFVTLYKKVKN